MEKKSYLNNTSLEDLTLIKNDIQNLNDYYSKTFNQFPKNDQNKKEEEKEESKQNEPETKKTEEKIKNENLNINNNNTTNIINNNPKEIKDTRELSSPIINPEYFYNFIKSETKSKNISSLSLSSFNYKTLKETFTGIGSYPSASRKFIWRYLLSLPNNINQFMLYSGKGIHPLYINLEKILSINENKMLIRLQKICSLISYWCPDIGKVSYLPKLLFPFLKCFPGDDLFVFETAMALTSAIYIHFIRFFPNFPVTHIRLIEEIIKKETNDEIKKIFDEVNIPLNELIWRMIKYLFSESLKKDDWLSLIDFLITYNHKTEMILYFCAAFFIFTKNEINVVNNLNRKNLIKLFIDNKQRREMNKIFNLTLWLYKKYSNTLQEFVYEPYMPQERCDKYKVINNLGNKFYDVIGKMKNEFMRGELDYDIGRQLMMNEDYKIILEKKYRELCNLEREIEYCRKDILEQEKIKNDILKWQLDVITHQRDATVQKIESINSN